MKRVTFSIPWPFTNAETRELLSFAFQVSLASYFIFFLIENMRSGFIASFFDSNIFLQAAIVIGLLSAIWPMIVIQPAQQKKPRWLDYVWMVSLALGSMIVIWYKTSIVGWPVFFVGPLTGLIVFGLSFLTYFDRDDQPAQKK